jgi:hypothetical protein
LRTTGGTRRLLIGGLFGLGGIILQGIRDISLHIPSNMFAVTILLGGLISCSATPRGRNDPIGQEKRRETA